MNTRDKITVISGWLDDVPSHAKEARKFMDELFEENTKMAMELEEVKNNSCISNVIDTDKVTITKKYLRYLETQCNIQRT